jgi:uncharacterized protein (DUF1499 family)
MAWEKEGETLGTPARRSMSWLAAAGFIVSLLALLAVMGAGAGTRLGLWDFRAGFRLLRWGAYQGVAGTVLSAGGAVLARPGRGSRGLALAAAGIVLGSLSFGVPAHWSRVAQRVPMIHDITTDTLDPPRFASVLPLRTDAPNSAEYGGPEIAAMQREAYPDIRPLEVGIPAAQAYERALLAARRMGWAIVDANAPEGRIEAVATTRWFGFKDDVVIRVAARPEGGSRVDIRSASRVGRSDLGTNAHRIRSFRSTFTGMGSSHPR